MLFSLNKNKKSTFTASSMQGANNANYPTITCFGGVGSVTGANFMLKVPKPMSKNEEGVLSNESGKVQHFYTMLIDCGLVQGSREAEKFNREPFGYDPTQVDTLLITHAHLDHVGRIGKLVKEGFSGRIISSHATKDLAELVMRDAAHIQAHDAKKNNLEPLYTEAEVDKALSLWITFGYHEKFEPIEGYSAVTCVMKDAGHILGSSTFTFTVPVPSEEKSSGSISKTETRNIVFTGDLGNTPTPILSDSEFIDDADYMLIESVYGDRNHEPKSERREKFKQVVQESLERRGTLVIPAFSVERTQVILYEINDLVETGQIKSVPVYLDSPLASQVTSVYHKNIALFNPEVQERIRKGDDIFNFPKLTIVASDHDSKSVHNVPGPKIIIAGSGMSMGGRVRRHEADYLPYKENTILLVGFQPIGTLGRTIQDGAKKVNIDGVSVPVLARIESIFGYSAHKDSDHLVEFVSHSVGRLKQVFVAMGEPKSSLFLAQRINDELDVKAMYPERGTEYQIK